MSRRRDIALMIGNERVHAGESNIHTCWIPPLPHRRKSRRQLVLLYTVMITQRVKRVCSAICCLFEQEAADGGWRVASWLVFGVSRRLVMTEMPQLQRQAVCVCEVDTDDRLLTEEPRATAVKQKQQCSKKFVAHFLKVFIFGLPAPK